MRDRKKNICLAKATNGWCWLTGTYTNGFIRKVKNERIFKFSEN